MSHLGFRLDAFWRDTQHSCSGSSARTTLDAVRDPLVSVHLTSIQVSRSRHGPSLVGDGAQNILPVSPGAWRVVFG
jgi:hypothetical protein